MSKFDSRGFCLFASTLLFALVTTLPTHAEIRDTSCTQKLNPQAIKFKHVQPAEFYVDPFALNATGINVALVAPFEVMEATLTHETWLAEIGNLPQSARSKPNETTSALLKRPVENISIWSAMVLANRLSEKNGLQPFYNLSRMRFKEGTSAELGTLVPVSPEENDNILINAPDGDLTQAEGYRLPTHAEQQYIHRNITPIENEFFHQIDTDPLNDINWFLEEPVNTVIMWNTDDSDFYLGKNPMAFNLGGNQQGWTYDYFDEWRKDFIDIGKKQRQPIQVRFVRSLPIKSSPGPT